MTRQNLKLVISKNPGIKFRELMRFTGMKNGVLAHHLAKLERTGTVLVQRTARETRFFPLDVSQDNLKLITALRRETPRIIIQTLIYEGKPLEFSEISDKISKAPSTISFYLSKLVEDEIVQKNFSHRKKKFQIKDKILVDQLIEQYYPGKLERPTAGLEDIINSL